jgi:cysteinyl-tRNA synthetase
METFSTITSGVTAAEPDPKVIEALTDDLNTSLALSCLHELAKEGRAEQLRASMDLLGLEALGTFWMSNDVSLQLSGLEDQLSAARIAAMASKDFSTVDTLKSALIAAGVEVRMSKSGVELVPGPDFDPAKLEAIQ